MTEENKKEMEIKTETTSVKPEINISNTLTVVVAVLVIMSAVQVFQLQGLVSAISNGTVKASAQAPGSSPQLQSQVGGCG